MCLPEYASICEIHGPQPADKGSVVEGISYEENTKGRSIALCRPAEGRSVNEPAVHVFVCVGVAEVLQGRKAMMHEKMKCTCPATLGPSRTNFHYFVLQSGWIASDKPDRGLKAPSLLEAER